MDLKSFLTSWYRFCWFVASFEHWLESGMSRDLTKLPLGDQQAGPECVRSTEWARNDVTCHPELLKPPSRKTFYKQERLVYTQWQLGPSLMFRKSN